MDNELENLVNNLKNDSTILSNEKIRNNVILNINRIIVELKDLTSYVVKGKDNIFPMLLLGAELERTIKEILEIKQKFLKK